MSMKPGYLLKITTWENDGDNYNTWEKDGLSANDVRFYVMIANLFRSHSRGTGFGNGDVPSYDSDVSLYDEHIDQLLAGFRANGGIVPTEWDKLTDPVQTQTFGNRFYDELVDDMIGTWCDGEYYRVFDSFKVFFVPDPIKDVTDEFSNLTS